MRYEDASGAFQASGPIANDDADTLAAGSRGPATGNLITGEGTQYGAAGADSAAGAHVAAIAGQGGEDSSFSGGRLSVAGQFGSLTVDAEGNYSYLANKGAPENVRDRFTYTLADNQGNTDTGALIVEIGKTPAVIKADAQQIVPGPDGVVTLPPGVELSDIMVVGRNLVVNMPDGTQLIIVDGAVFVPQLSLGGVEVPSTNVAALLIGQEVQPAAGETPPSSGGNFALPPPPLDPGIPLGDLLPPTEYDYIPPEPQEVLDTIDEEPEIFVQPDGQPASVAAVDQVEEAGLPSRNGNLPGEPAGSGESADGNGADNDVATETTGGNIVYDSPDGVASITLNGVAITAVGQVINGAFGTLTITSIAPGVIGYSYTLADNTAGNDTHDDFSVVLTDNDGDTATATLRIDIIDDVPTARPDTDVIASGQFGPATGNVITDASAGDAGDSDAGADTVGADNATITAVSSVNVPANSDNNPAGGFVVNGQYGVLTLNTDGSYSYVRNPGTPGGVNDVFNYTLTDGDGDTSTTTLTISIGDATPETRPNPTAQLDDDALPNGIPGGVGDDPDAVNLSGNLTGVGGDGPLTFNVLLTGAPAGFSYVSGGAGVVLVQQGGVTVLTVTVNSATGAYTIVQNAPIDHPAGSDENNVSFTINYNVTDQDGDTAAGTIAINVDDDTPEMNRADVSVPTLTVDETDLAANASADYSVVFDGAYGADGPGTTSYAVSVVNGTASGLVDVATGDPILLFMNGGVVEGRVGGADGPVAFTVSVNSGTGVVTLDQVRALVHPDNPDNDEPVSAIADSIKLTATITDGDGDSDSLSVNIGHTLVFEDDGPSVSPELNADATVTVDESLPSNDPAINTGAIVKGNDPDLAGGIALGQANSGVAIVDANAAFGADGPAASGSVTYALSITNTNAGVTLTDGTPIELQLVGGVIVGVVDGGAFDGQAAFAIAIDPTTGVVTVEQYLSLDHPANPDPNDPLGLGDNTVAVTVTATDGDGDPVTSGNIDISGQITFLDDGPSVAPTVNAQATVTVDESLPSNDPAINTGAIVKGNDPDLAGGIALGQANSGVAIVNANAVFGADGAGANGGLGYALSITNASSGLTLTDGSAINLQLVGGVIVGVVATGPFAGQAAFAIAINPTTGVVTVEQYLSLDHPANPDPNDPLGLGDNTVAVTVTATDGDGDPVTSGAVDISDQITFLDDGPSVAPTVNAQATVTVDESLPSNDPAINTGAIVKGNDPDLAGGIALGQANSGVAIVNANAVFGADGAAAGGGISYALSITNAASGLTLTDGSAINLQLVGGVIVGVVATGPFAGQAAFAIAIDPTTGVVSVEQYLSLDHPLNPNPNDPLGLGDNTIAVTVTATDGDGDPVTSGAVDISDQITFLDDGPDASDEPQQNVQEGNQTVSGTFDFVGGADGATVTHINGIALTFGGDGWSQWIAVDDGQIRAQADGDYQFQSDASGSGVTSGTYTVTDGDGDPDTANWAFNITDANAPTAGVSAARLDDDGLAGGNPLSTTGDIDANVGEAAPVNSEEDIFHGQLTLNFGGDGPGTVTFAAMHNLTGTVGTETVRYTWAGSTLTATVEGGARNGTVLFDIVVNQTTGEYTLTLRDNVIHAAGGDEASAPNVALTYTVTDSDNSPAGGVNGTLNITFNDDAPTLTNIQPGAGVDVDETDAGTPAGFPISDTSAGAVITATQAFGADGAAAANSVVYGLTVQGGSPQLTTLQTAVGNFPITLVAIDGDTIQGQYQNGGTQVAFTIQMNANGTVTLTQNVALEHNTDSGPAPTGHNDTLNLNGLINATITITDGDGDTASGSTPIGSNLVFFDDGPDAQVDTGATLDQLTLDETRPLGQETDGDSDPAGLATITANFANNFVGAVDYGADGAGTVSYSLALSGTNVGSGLYALDATDTTIGDGDGIGRGAEIVLNISGDGLTITGSVGATNYFTISIDPVTGVVTFTQLNNIWHGSTASDDDTSTLTTAAAANVQVVQRVTDSDGDFDTAAVNVGQGVFHIEDDGPEFTAPPVGVAVENGDTTAQIESLNLEIGTDGFGLLFFDSAVDGDAAQDAGGNNLTFNGEQLFYQVNGNILTAETADGDVGFTITLNQDGTYSFQLHGVISNGTETSFTDLTSAAAGNVNFRLVGSDVGNNNAENTDLVLSGNGTVNTNSTSMGVNNQSMETGERIRIDFVENLETVVGPGDPPNGPQGFHHSGHVTTTHFEQLIAQTNGNPDTVVDMRVTAILADEDNDYGNDPVGGVEAGEDIVDIESVTVNFAIGVSHTFVKGDPASLSFLHTNADGSGTTTTSVVFNADGSVSILNLQEGDQYEIDTSDPFSAVVNASLEGPGSYDLGILSIGSISSGDPIVQDFGIVAQDRDGDQETSTISTTINPPADTLAATSFMAQEEQLQKSSANSNTLTLAAAVGASGLAESSASEPTYDPAVMRTADVSGASYSNESVEKLSAEDGGTSNALSGELPEASDAAGSANSSGRGNGNANGHDNQLDAGSNQQSSDDGSSHQAANDQGPAANAEPQVAAPPTVTMVSAEALQAAGLDGEAKHNGSVEKIVAEALGEGEAPTVDGLLAHLAEGLGEVPGLAHVASQDAGSVPGWDMANAAPTGAGFDMLFKVDVAMHHQDAIQPAING